MKKLLLYLSLFFIPYMLWFFLLEPEDGYDSFKDLFLIPFIPGLVTFIIFVFIRLYRGRKSN